MAPRGLWDPQGLHVASRDFVVRNQCTVGLQASSGRALIVHGAQSEVGCRGHREKVLPQPS